MTRELLAPLVVDEATVVDLAWLLNTLVHNREHTLADFVRSGNIIPLTKPNNEVRPIVLADALLKVTGSCAVRRCRERLDTIFGEMQFALIGTEEAAHRIRELHESQRFLLAVDCKNAYGSVIHAALAEAVGHDPLLAPLHDMLALELSGQSLLRFGDTPFALSRGTRQGSTISPAIFALALMPILRNLEGVSVTAFLDDITLAAETEVQLENAAAQLRQGLERIGLVINTIKTHTNSRKCADTLGCAVSSAVSTLSVCFGTMQESIDAIAEIAAEQAASLKRLEGVPHQHAWSMLRCEAPAKMVYVARTNPPAEVRAAAKSFDEAVNVVADTICPVSNDEERKLRSLPATLGGLGLRPMSRILEYAFTCRVKGSQQTATKEAEEQVAATLPERFRRMTEETAEASLWMSTHRTGARLHDDAWATHVRHVLDPKVPAFLRDTAFAKGPRHDQIRDELLRALREEGHQVIREPLLLRGQTRSDILVLPNTGARGTLVDVTVAVSQNDSWLSTAERAATRKRDGYATAADDMGLHFCPFVVSTRGALGHDAAVLLRSLCANPAAVARRVLQRLVVANARLGCRAVRGA